MRAEASVPPSLRFTSTEPEFCDHDKPIWRRFTFEKLLDSNKPGSNFSTGLGLGVAVVVERASSGKLELPAGDMPQRAFLRIDNAEVEFTSRTINDEVKV